MVSIKPVSNHCTVVAGTAYSAMMAGSATDSEVSFKIMMVAAPTRTANVVFTSAGSLSGLAAVAGAWVFSCDTRDFFLN